MDYLVFLISALVILNVVSGQISDELWNNEDYKEEEFNDYLSLEDDARIKKNLFDDIDVLKLSNKNDYDADDASVVVDDNGEIRPDFNVLRDVNVLDFARDDEEIKEVAEKGELESAISAPLTQDKEDPSIEENNNNKPPNGQSIEKSAANVSGENIPETDTNENEPNSDIQEQTKELLESDEGELNDADEDLSDVSDEEIMQAYERLFQKLNLENEIENQLNEPKSQEEEINVNEDGQDVNNNLQQAEEDMGDWENYNKTQENLNLEKNEYEDTYVEFINDNAAQVEESSVEENQEGQLNGNDIQNGNDESLYDQLTNGNPPESTEQAYEDNEEVPIPDQNVDEIKDDIDVKIDEVNEFVLNAQADLDALVDSIIRETEKEGSEEQEGNNDGTSHENTSDEEDEFVKNLEQELEQYNVDDDNDEAVESRVEFDEPKNGNLEELYNKLTDFKIEHSSEIYADGENFAKDIPPIKIELEVDQPTVITSVNYPAPYTGQENIIDWILEGVEGTGMELNITDLSLNLDNGDYLLVKPGDILDTTSHQGLIFTDELQGERKYRYFDYDNLFIRFVTHYNANNQYRGFNISVRSIDYKQTEDDNQIVLPEELLTAPKEVYTVFLSGASPQSFTEIIEQFKQLLVEMTNEYMVDRGMDRGNVSLSDAVQVTRVASCIINWPSADNCVAVSFGVPLSLSEEDGTYQLDEFQLEDLWMTYSNKEQYKGVLESLGLYSFVIPNDAAIMTLWLVISAAIIFTIMLLAVAIWRCNYFEEYKGMRRLSETDSVSSMRKSSSLFPTPHQNLPPIYTEAYWSDDETPPPKYADASGEKDGQRGSNVNAGIGGNIMGGSNNDGFVKDGELFNLDSDEEIVMSLPDDKNNSRKPHISRNDIYPV